MNIKIDTSTWDQNRIIMLQATVVSILYKNNVTYKNLYVEDSVVCIDNPTDDPSSLLVPEVLKQEYNTWLCNQQEADTLNQRIQEEKQLCLDTNKINSESLENLVITIQDLKDLESVKTFLTDLISYLKLKGI